MEIYLHHLLIYVSRFSKGLSKYVDAYIYIYRYYVEDSSWTAVVRFYHLHFPLYLFRYTCNL